MKFIGYDLISDFWEASASKSHDETNEIHLSQLIMNFLADGETK
jgi:hypothetical protein